MSRQISSLSDYIVSRIAKGLTDAELPLQTPLVVAYSGGVDSSVLLQAVIEYREQYNGPIHAVHVHHGLSENADSWARHCELQCRLEDVEFHLHRVEVDTSARKSIEAEARKVRYNALLAVCKRIGGVLLLGQHAEDQLETVLLQLKRGAGPQGLAGMGEVQYRGNTLIMRPMLSLDKAEIVTFADNEMLQWVDDESNQQNSFDRNFLRNEIIPHLLDRWPQLTKTVGRSAVLCAEQSELVNDSAQRYFEDCKRTNLRLDGQKLTSLSRPWQAMVIRAWFKAQGQLSPSKAQAEQVLLMLEAKHDATPEVNFKWGKVIRFDGDLYWVVNAVHDAEPSGVLHVDADNALPWLNGNLHVSLLEKEEGDTVTFQTNARNLRIKPVNASVSKLLKEWFKVWRVPRWERNGVPVIFLNEQAVALIISGQCIYLQPKSPRIKLSFTQG
ncbi:tRNA lysidine(34) synthetase TilS [Alteromonas mediterranea]|uniref:tRNA lysidine(34) synthetase TilS n=1 Tax=Alteromonas mediterranea TaxID=314275 RepID=UPI0003554E51|nr:tRNA lysidine(34) synthetase TilS [Alteromonas mediterranea]AGP84743.1 cell cycle protein MesJ [Alteromonas mediterranea U4]AGP88858.1 cell cycle protein MesJ [Alteromonas mediterranea U7]AGP92742.1 cell cycle protein MesJ [Alteromonas mediterranea U8]MDY6882320.1 tRNA lysidine(34) synthetase TilS [Pseudomonadota bacterium]